ncbi:MAG: hypothetical protein ACFFBP_13585 [Promethearchaeota archaeon]
MLNTIAFFCMIMILSIVIRKTLYRIESGPFKKILHVLDFIGVIVHELGHVIACLLIRVPIKEIHFGWRSERSTKVAPHGHVRLSPRKWTFLKSAVVGFAPLIASTWLFILCFNLFFNVNVPDLLSVFYGFMCLSLVLGASPSSTDLGNIVYYFNKDVQYSLYQLFLLSLSVFSIFLFLSIFNIVLFEFLYLFLIGIGYYTFKYGLLGLSKLFRNPYLRVTNKTNMNTYTRRTHRPLEPYKIGIEEAHW